MAKEKALSEPSKLIQGWIKLKQEIDKFTIQEKTIRGELVQHFFKKEHENLDSRGTFTAVVEELKGVLKLQYGQNVKFDQDIFKISKTKLEEELDQVGDIEFNSLFKVKYELNEGLFAKLPKETRLKILKYGFLEFNRASPSVKFNEKEPV